MSGQNEIFFTVVGCMDGRCQRVVFDYGARVFGAEFPDSITEPGIVGILAKGASPEFLENLRMKILISLEKHNSKGIVVDGHAECAGNPVDDNVHKDDVRRSVEVIKSLVGPGVPVAGVFVERSEAGWKVTELTPVTFLA